MGHTTLVTAKLPKEVRDASRRTHACSSWPPAAGSPSPGSRCGSEPSSLVTSLFARRSLGSRLDAPTTNADGTPLTDLSSYRIYFGTSSNPCQGPSVQHVPSPSPAPTAGDVVTSRLAGLTAGAAYYVQVTALDNNGNESLCSDQATGVATADGSDSTA